MQGVFAFCRDLPPRPKRPERLFFALSPDAETAFRVVELGRRFSRENHLTGTPLRPERLHVSLHHIGDYKRLRSKFIYAARLAAKAVSMRPFEARFRFIASFEGAAPVEGRPRRPLVLLGEGDGISALHESLGAAMAKNGLRAARRFTPHMTLLYGPKPVPMRAIEEPIRFAVDEFLLLHSELWLTRYNVIDRWPLHG